MLQNYTQPKERTIFNFTSRET